MRTCQRCQKCTNKGYTKNPRTGRETKYDFYCDPCFEHVMQYDAQLREYSLQKASVLSRRGKHENY